MVCFPGIRDALAFNPVFLFMTQEITLKRNCTATLIPSGDEVTLAEGNAYAVAQSLGGSVTLRDTNGLYRVRAEDMDALGDEFIPETGKAEEKTEDSGPLDETKVWDAMRGCYDPEIPVNIVDLGLIYDMQISGEKGIQLVEVKMTLTAQGCGMGPVIAEDAKGRIEKLSGVSEARVDIVWDPPWNPRMISGDGKKVLGLE